MTLNEKFINLLLKSTNTTDFEKIAEEFAIGFANWILNDWFADERWSKISDEKELLEIYKKEKRL